MTTQQELLLKKLNELAIPYTWYDHPAAFTVEEAVQVAGHVPGAWCKNLFLKDSKKRLYLITALYDTKIELKKVAKALPAPELRFADAQLLEHYLGLTPGSVTPLGLINDTSHAVTVILDKKLFNHSLVGVHPLINTATITLAPQDLQKFVTHSGNALHIVDFETL